MSDSNSSMSLEAQLSAPSVTPATEATEEAVESQEEQEQEVEQEASENPVAELPKKEQKELVKQMRKFKLKVDGQEYEEEIDLSDEEGLKKHLQMSKAAQKRMKEATELRKAAEQFIDILRTNPRKVLSDPNIGVDLKKFAQEIMNEEIENASKSPEELEKEALTKELEELREKYKKDEEDRKQKEFERLQNDAEQKLESDIGDALKTSELPKTPYTVRKMAEIMMIALENNIDLNAKDVIPLMRKQMKQDITEMFSAASDDVLEELVGKDNISRLRKRNLAKAKKAVETASAVQPTGTEVKKEAKEPQKMTIRDFLKA